MHYWDKALYVFHDAKRNEEEDLNTPVEKSDKDLIKFLDDLIDISVIILEFYYESYPSRRSEIDILKNKRQLIADFLLKNLNSKKEPKIQTNSISFSELNKLFDDDLWILTPGHIREAAKEIEKMEMLKK